MKKLLQCRCSEAWQAYGPLVLRLAVGLVFLMHGWQKIQSPAGAVAGFFGSIGIPAPAFFAAVVTYVEFLGGIALILGFLSHWAAKLLAIDMLVAIFAFHWANGFFVDKGGMEFALVLFAANIAIMILGPGKWALQDTVFGGKKMG